MGWIIPYIIEHKKCLKPPTSIFQCFPMIFPWFSQAPWFLFQPFICHDPCSCCRSCCRLCGATAPSASRSEALWPLWPRLVSPRGSRRTSERAATSGGLTLLPNILYKARNLWWEISWNLDESGMFGKFGTFEMFGRWKSWWNLMKFGMIFRKGWWVGMNDVFWCWIVLFCDGAVFGGWIRKKWHGCKARPLKISEDQLKYVEIGFELDILVKLCCFLYFIFFYGCLIGIAGKLFNGACFENSFDNCDFLMAMMAVFWEYVENASTNRMNSVTVMIIHVMSCLLRPHSFNSFQTKKTLQKSWPENCQKTTCWDSLWASPSADSYRENPSTWHTPGV